MLIFAFKHLHEVNVQKIKRIPIKDSIKAIKGNWPWILIVTSNLIFWIGLTIRQSTVVYYCQYYLDDKSLTALFNGLISIGIIGTMLIPLFVRYLHKFGVMIAGFIILIIAHISIFYVGKNMNALIAIWIFSAFGHFIACSMPFAMLSDTVDFGEWKTGIRASGFLTAIGSAFCIKAGSGIGGFIPAMVMNAFGYIPNQLQSASSLLGIRLIFTWLPALIFALGIIPLIFYRKYEANEATILTDLAKKNN
ncbi:MFS transporter [Pectinatus brassicae]|uniref:Na+/melibiose symporter-like transporter n=1 Tax=Pectinatus brassicae TaxID=862415 RepID=A0A840UD73_9FIRM|nr:MFS transporter [Pectinatus brassicae]MBB5334959.1 Na+/melibiose symporter-like transporter [Pectinatus brassicae]